MSSTYHPAFNAISFHCDYRTRIGCPEYADREAHTGLPDGWVNRDGGHLCREHANAELQTATIDKPHMFPEVIYNDVFEDGTSRPYEGRAWEPATQTTLF